MYGQHEYIGLDQDILKTSSEEVWLIRIYSSSLRLLEDVLKTSFEDEDERHLEDVFIKTNVCWDNISIWVLRLNEKKYYCFPEGFVISNVFLSKWLYDLFVVHSNFLQKFLWSLKFFWLVSILSFKNLSLNLDLFIVNL